MAQKIINDTYLTNIADAIRARKGTSNAILTKNMANEIRSIQSGIGDEFIIVNGKEQTAISDTLIGSNNFIHLISPGLAILHNDLTLPGTPYRLEPVDNNKFLAFYKMGNTGIVCHYFEVTANATIRTYDLVEVPCPFGKYEDTLSGGLIAHKYPTRIFKANNGGYFFQAWYYWIPFIINNNNRLEFGDSYQDSDLAPLILENNSPRYTQQNMVSYGRYGDDWVIYNTIYDPSAYKLWTAVVQINNNTIQRVKYIARPDVTGAQHDNGNIYPLDESAGKYFMSYRENLNGSYVTNFIPISAQLSNNDLQITFGNYNNTISGYFNSGYKGIVLPTNNSGEYCAIAENCELMILLNNDNVGYNAVYTGSPLILTPILIQDSTNYSLYNINNNGIFPGYTYLGDNYYGWITGERGKNSNNITTYNYYLAIAELVNGTLIYRGRSELISSTDEYSVNIKYINGYLYLVDNGDNLRIYQIETNISKIKLRESGETIDGISATDINSYGGTV